MAEIKTELCRLDKTKSNGSYHALITYINDVEFKRTFITDLELELATLKGVQVVDLRNKDDK